MYEVKIWNNIIKIETHEELFSPKGPDLGTLSMLKAVDISEDDKILDLACGSGIVGISVGKEIGEDKVVMVDVDPLAVEYSKKNAVLNGLENIKIFQSDGLSSVGDRDFTLILSNPPYHTDFSVAKSFIEDGFKHLKVKGKMALVVKRLTWYKNKMNSVFGGVKVIEDNDYYILISEKRDISNKKRKDKPIKKKHLKRMEKTKKRKKI